MLLHPCKREALIQLINCDKTWSVKNITDLSDGKLFCDIIKTKFSSTIEHFKTEGVPVNFDEQPKDEGLSNPSENQKMICNDAEYEDAGKENCETHQKSDKKLIKSAVPDCESAILPTNYADESVSNKSNSAAGNEETATESTNSAVCNGESVFEHDESANNNLECPTELAKPSDGDKEIASKRFRIVQYFINVKYHVKSETMIAFSECLDKNELELAKVLIFIMAEVVHHFVHTDKNLINTLSLVENEVQLDLEQCFTTFINRRNQLSSQVIELVLTTCARKKTSNSPNNTYSTPRNCSSKYRRQSKQESPLVTYFKSPIFTKADILSKEKEIYRIRQMLFEEENNSCSLQRKIQDLEKTLKEKDKEINNFKTRNRMLQEKEETEECENCIKHEKTVEENKRRIKELEENIKEHNEETQKKFEDIFLDYQIEVAETISGFHYHLYNAEKEIREVSKQLDETKKMKDEKEDIIKKLSELLEEKTKELDVYKEKLYYADEKFKEPESPELGECMGRYFKGESSIEEFDTPPVNLQMHPEERSVKHVMVQFPEQAMDTMEVIHLESDVSISELAVSNDLPDSENTQNLKKCSENAIKEFSDVCDVSNKLNSTSEQIVYSAPKEAPFADYSCPSVTIDSVGSLWHHYNTSISENENENNNYPSITNDGVSIICHQNNNISENNNTEGTSRANNGLTKALNILQKTESDLNQMAKHFSAISKVSSVPNGSNGLSGSPVLRDFLEELKKSVQKSVLCLSQIEESQINVQNNNSISKNMIDEAGGNSDVAVFSKCLECSKVGNDLPNSITTINQDSAALLEKCQELKSLKDKYKVALKSWTLKEKELENCKKKYAYLKIGYHGSLRNVKDVELKCQKLEIELKEARKRENDIKRESKREKNILKMQIREMGEKWQKLQSCVLSFKMKVKDMGEENKTLREELSLRRNVNERLSSHIKYLEKQIEEFNSNVNQNGLSSTSSTATKNKGVEGIKDEDTPSENANDDSLKPECLLSNLSEVVPKDAGNESTISGALSRKNLHSGLHLHNYDEAEFFNHSSLLEIQNGPENSDLDITRLIELNRRNTMLPNHLQSTYPAESLPMTPGNENYSKYVPDLKCLEKSGHLVGCHVNAGKKRKVSEIETDQSSQFATPVVKTKRRFLQTPTSLKKWCFYRRNQRSGSIKPKP